MTARPSRPSPFRPPRPPRYRLEWRRLVETPFEPALCDLHFETAARPDALRLFALSVAALALGGEFRMEAPDRRSVYTDVDRIHRWRARPGTLPDEAPGGMWRSEVRLRSDVEEMVSGVRAAVIIGVDRGAIGMRDALFVADMARSVARRFPV